MGHTALPEYCVLVNKSVVIACLARITTFKSHLHVEQSQGYCNIGKETKVLKTFHIVI